MTEVRAVVEIVGRIPQRAQLSRWLVAAISGQPAVVVLDGSPGVGKSTLVSWLVAEAAGAGATTRIVVVPERGDVADDLGAAIADTDEQMRRGVPQLLVIDDAHWLDDAGQHLVEHLAFRLGTAAVTGQAARVCLLLVARSDASSRLISHLVDEPITRRMSLATLDDREARELARQITPGITDRRTLARLAELSGGNPLTLNALADSIALGEVLPSPASTTGTIPVEVAWRARLATLSKEALRAAVLIALAEQAVQSRGPDDVDLLADIDVAVDELQTMGAVQRRAGGVAFTHPLLRTTALDLASLELIVEVAGQLLDQLDAAGGSTAAGTLVRLSDAAHRTADQHHRDLVRRAYDEAIDHGSWSAAGDLAEYLTETTADAPDRAHWTHRLGNARFNELDRDAATERLIEAAELYQACVPGAAPDAAATYRNARAESLLLALRTDFTRGGPRRHAELDQMAGALIEDASISPLWRARAAAILVEATYAMPQHDRRRELIEQAETLALGVDDSLTIMMVQFARGWHGLATLDLVSATDSFTAADHAALAQPDPWWRAGSLARRAMVGLVADRSLVAVADATASMERSARTSNWAEHGVALAARSIANTRIGRFVDADNDTESMILSARRADAVDPFLMSMSTALWRRAARGDEPGVEAIVKIARHHQLHVPFAHFVATTLLRGVEAAVEEHSLRWMPPRRDLAAHNLGFHLSQLEAAVLAGNLEVVDALLPSFERVYERGARASFDWPLSIALVMAEAAIELGDPKVDIWIERAAESAVAAGSVLEQAILDVQRARHAFMTGRGGQAELDLSRSSLDTLDGLGAPLVARLHRERLTAVAGRLGTTSGRVRTVMFTDIVDSTRLMASAGNAAWAVVLGEHHHIVRSTVGRFRGSIMTATGDGFSAWFEHPRDAADAALALHAAIEHAALIVAGGVVAVRVGLASGSVFDLGGDVSGLAVAEAARVMSTAGAGETHISRSAIDHGLDVPIGHSLGAQSLKGLPKPVEVFVLARPGST